MKGKVPRIIQRENVQQKRDTKLKSKPKNFTHFLSIPLNVEKLIHKLEKFKKKVEQEHKDLKQFFTDFKKLHLTICMLTLET